VTNSGENGILCEPNADEFAKAMEKLTRDASIAKNMGKNGRKRVENVFSISRLSNDLNMLCCKLLEGKLGRKAK
jgi:glycosyltransferase involved in cell wall biosynthesis